MWEIYLCWTTDIYETTQEIVRFQDIRKFITVSQILSSISVLSQSNPVYKLAPYLYIIHFNIILVSKLRSNYSLSVFSRLFNQLLDCSMRVSCPVHFKILNLIRYSVSSEEYKLYTTKSRRFFKSTDSVRLCTNEISYETFSNI
jgi:hypothetical protein